MYPDHNLKIFKTISQFTHVWYWQINCFVFRS